ncbi:polyphosphate polymerase domain-containing protein [Anaerobium acetethylicum]|uniref:VTC domain-containing protein n=1 Tax=Anaerobium acetethylicum TaxID=1619234 RepID=A0A1D3TTC8_9FIRM|nr:polyphosphate polymerase domain-containing protein [Anaerobium acetethylicum]SCP97166.1 VTC domain-containing protein [Anaerobium acetethylicum]
MNQYQETFKRYEKKYLLSEKKYRMLRQKLQNRLHIDNYGKVTICNIYFDTPESLLIRTSLDKPVYKEKLRLRSYGTPARGDKVFIELKKKYKGIVYKRRVDMELSEAEHYLYDRIPVKKPSQITREIDWVLGYYEGLVPAMYISYNRIAMYGSEDPQLRVTFDSNILWRREQLSLESGAWGNALLEEGQRLMEIKIPGAMPLWLAHILDELEIYPISFSKYGKGYQESEKLEKSNTDSNVIRRGEIRYA